MMTPQQFTKALGLTESQGKIEQWGDDTHGTKPPLAMGRFQIHPAWLWDHTRTEEAKPADLESWDSWIERLITAFYRKYHVALPDDILAMWFHLGHRSYTDSTDWDSKYAERFNEYAKNC